MSQKDIHTKSTANNTFKVVQENSSFSKSISTTTRSVSNLSKPKRDAEIEKSVKKFIEKHRDVFDFLAHN